MNQMIRICRKVKAKVEIFQDIFEFCSEKNRQIEGTFASLERNQSFTIFCRTEIFRVHQSFMEQEFIQKLTLDLEVVLFVQVVGAVTGVLVPKLISWMRILVLQPKNCLKKWKICALSDTMAFLESNLIAQIVQVELSRNLYLTNKKNLQMRLKNLLLLDHFWSMKDADWLYLT